MTAPLINEEIHSCCARWSDAMKGIAGMEEKIEYASAELPRLLRQKEIFIEILCNLVKGEKYPDPRAATMFDNELLLYSDPGRLFSLRLFIWEPGQYTDTHDHGSWGVIGPVSGKLEVVNYRRLDDGAEKGWARLAEKERLLLVPGETTFTLPMNEGIHKIGNPTQRAILSLSIYGSPIARGYVLGFDIPNGKTFKILAPPVRKKLLAIQALPTLDRESAENALKEAREHRLDIIRDASLAAS